MPDIGSYTEKMQLFLCEASKYFALLLFCILAIRLWRRWTKVSAAHNANGLLWAVAATVLAVVIGYCSVRQSLASLYSYYGMQAFRAVRLTQALSLFDMAEKNWRDADTLGQKGVCLLLLGDVDNGLAMISQARAMRKGRGTPFEDFYEGLYHFTKGETHMAVPLLQASTADDIYRWSVIKIFAVMELDQNRVADVAEQMKPFMQADVTELDQAYIMASLKLAAGQKAEAQALVDKFAATNNLPALWQGRFEKLRKQLKN
jgi:tetratricopeptide (TPR) repeat protein